MYGFKQDKIRYIGNRKKIESFDDFMTRCCSSIDIHDHSL